MINLFQNVLTPIFAIIGSFTGIISLIIQLKSHIQTNSSLKLKLFRNSFYFNVNDVNLTSYDTNYCAVVSVKIDNKSSFPITITEAIAKNKYYKTSHMNDFKFTPERICNYNTGVMCCMEPEECAKLPIRLEPYDSAIVSFRFIYADKLIVENKCIFKLLLHTSRKTHKLKVNLNEYHSHLRYQQTRL